MRTEIKMKKAQDTLKGISRTILFPVSGTLSTGTNSSLEIALPNSFYVVEVYLNVKTAPTGAELIVDVNLGGTTIFTTQSHRPEIAAGATTGNTTDIDEPTLAKNSILSVDIDQVGSTVAGADLVVEVRCKEM